MKRTITLALAAILLLTLAACAGNAPVANTTEPIAAPPTTTAPTAAPTAPTEEPPAALKFRDMTVQEFLAEIGPGHSETHLAECDPRYNYDPFVLPTSLDFGVWAADGSGTGSTQRLTLNETVSVEFPLSDLPEGAECRWWGTGINVATQGTVSVSVKIENARIEMPDKTVMLAATNGTFDFADFPEKNDNGSMAAPVATVENTDLADSAALRKGSFKADVTLLKVDCPVQARAKALYYSDQKKYGLPDLTPEWFRFLYSEGFRSIRFQTTWFNHTNDETYEIDRAWLDRVAELVQLALDEGLYCTVNVNWDMSPNYFGAWGMDYNKSGWLTLDGNPKVEERFAAVWRQIAEYFKDYDEHIIFEAVNEPMVEGIPFDAVPNDILANLDRLNQIFVDTVRSTGGNNEKRFLIVNPYNDLATDSILSRFVMPVDPAEHTVVSIHYYLDIFDNIALYKNDAGEPYPAIEKYLLSKGIGVVFTEFGSEIKTRDLQSRIDFTRSNVAKAKELGIAILYYGSDSEGDTRWYRLYDWNTFEPYQPEIIDILFGREGN